MERPLWVQLGLWGLKTRSSVLAFFALSVISAIVLLAFGKWWGVFLVGSALWYWMVMKWVDKHDRW
jgi:hypothetical protein